MDSSFQEKNGRVVVIDGSGATRTLVSETIKKLGFTDITGVASVMDAIQYMEAEAVNWVITSTFKDQSESAFKLLKLITLMPDLRNVRMSLMVDDEEKDLLPFAFQLGLVSWHPKPFTKDTLNEQLEILMKRYEESSFRPALVAEKYLREILTETNQDQLLVDIQKSLLKQYPSETDLMLNMVPPKSRLGKKDDAVSMLRQVKIFDPSLEGIVKEYAEKYTQGEIEGGENLNVLNLEKVIVVDSDAAFQDRLKEVLSDLGIPEAQVFADGEAAAEHIKANQNPDLILMDWRLPKLAGPLFIQRIRSEGAEASPIIVLSEVLEPDDHPLIKEMGVAMVVEKPCEKNIILRRIIMTVQQDRMPTEKGSLERKMREFLKLKKFADAAALKSKYMENPDVDRGSKETISAEFAYCQGDYERSRDHAIEAIKLSGDSLYTLNLLGKVMMNLREFDTALKCFKKAQALSPKNIERLCSIAEVQSEQGNEEEANKTLEEAGAIDPDNAKIAESKTKVAINSGDTSRAKELMSQLDAIENVVAFMNNSAVAMARCNMLDQSVEQYRKTLKSIPDGKEETKAVVMYNMALAHLRADEIDEAIIYLERCRKTKSKVSEKAAGILKKVKRATEKGLKISLKSATPTKQEAQNTESKDAGSSEEEKEESKIVHEVEHVVNINPGDIGLFMIFNPPDISANQLKLVENLPRFKKRKSIEKDESMGADKAIKNAG